MALYSCVDKETCISCGACGTAAPDIFGYDGDGLAENRYGGDRNRGVVDIPKELHDDLDDACSGCPTGSIQVSGHPFETIGNA